jgi:hypothetical protein
MIRASILDFATLCDLLSTLEHQVNLIPEIAEFLSFDFKDKGKFYERVRTHKSPWEKGPMKVFLKPKVIDQTEKV